MRKQTHRHNPFYKVLLIYFVLQISTLMLFFINDSLNGQLLQNRINFDSVVVFRIYIFIIFIFTNVFILYLLKKLYIYINSAEKSKIESAKYRYLETELKVYRKHRHDMKNHLMIIYEFSNSSRYEELQNYISKYYKDITKAKLSIETGIDELDMLFANKFSQFRASDIPFTFNKSTYLNLDDTCVIDLVSLFSNILDNAYEACQKVKSKNDQLISINIMEDPLDYIFVVTNTTLPMAPLNRFRIEGVSTKAKKKGHGLGLSIIENLVSKYDGISSFEVLNDKFFQVKIEIPKHSLYSDWYFNWFWGII